MSQNLLFQISVVAALAMAPSSGRTQQKLSEHALLVFPRQAPRYTGQQGRGSDVTELLATGEQTGGRLGIFRQTIAPGSGPPTHIHETEVEFAYVLSGDFKFKLGERVVSVPVGSFMFVPHMTAHTFKTVGKQPSILLFGVSGGGLEKMFAERQGVDAVTNIKLMDKYHMKVVGPPIM